jgi:hypothetical protein
MLEVRETNEIKESLLPTITRFHIPDDRGYYQSGGGEWVHHEDMLILLDKMAEECKTNMAVFAYKLGLNLPELLEYFKEHRKE